MTSNLREFGLDYISGPIPDSKQAGCYVFSTVRNEILRLPYLLHYYREMGAILFIFADNLSDDGTAEYLRTQSDVLLFHASGRYSESKYGVDWVNALLYQYGQKRWCLTIDADELLVFPHCEKLGLNQLTRYLDKMGANAFPTFLLDMYSKEPIHKAKYEAGKPFLSVCPYFDPDGYSNQKYLGSAHEIPVRGGPRQRLFWDNYVREKPSPYLLKLPLVRWATNVRYDASTHIITNAQVSDITGALLHFKLFADFIVRVQEEVNRGEHFNKASQFLAYSEIISSQPALCAYHEDTVEYKDSIQLTELGLIHTSEEFDRVRALAS